MNYVLSFTIYLGFDAVMTARLSTYKSRFIYHFNIAFIKKDYPLIKDQYRSFDVDVPRVGVTASSQPYFYCFNYGSGNRITSMNFLVTFIH